MSQAGKGHVPEENLMEYRELAGLARRLETLSTHLGWQGEYLKGGDAKRWSQQFWEKANALRVDLPSSN